MSTQAISASVTRPVSVGHGLPPGAIALMLMLCVSWGFNQLAVKLALPDVPPMLQALIRSSGALPVMLIVGRLRGVKFFERDGTLLPGVIAGLMFGCEFVLIFTGLVFTSASRASVFLYTAPFFVALGSHQFLGERLSTVQWSGLALSFAGVALAIGVPQPNVDAKVLLGDLMVVGGGALWAATTLVAKGTQLRKAAPEKAPRLPGRDLDPDSRVRRLDRRRADRARAERALDLAARLSGGLGGGLHFCHLVCDGEDLFGEQALCLHLRHAAVRRGRGLFHHARHVDPGVRRRRAAGDRRPLSRQQARPQGVTPDPNVPA